MTNMNRRLFLLASGGLSVSPFVPQNTTNSVVANDVTRRLARYVVTAKFADLPAPVRKEAARTLLNWVGCTVGGSRHETVGIAVSALVAGVDVECRIGNSVYPKHYDVGWHITGTAGVFGAAAASGKLLGLSEQQMLWAIGLAATQPVGLQEMFGSMTKSFHPGRAAQNGLTAALLASKNFTSSEQSLEAKYGWLNVVSTAHNNSDITDKLGVSFEISHN